MVRSDLTQSVSPTHFQTSVIAKPKMKFDLTTKARSHEVLMH